MLRPAPVYSGEVMDGAEKAATREEMDEIRRARLAVPGDARVVWRDVDYSQGTAAAWFPRGEAPVLRSLVDKGLLPPVAERVGPEPVVLEGVDGIGTYGGAWNRIANSAGDVSLIFWRMSGSALVRWSPEGHPVVPHLAKGWEVSDDAREWTIHLRRGVRWSDGHPFTTEDVEYWFHEEVIRMGGVGSGLSTRGVPAEFERIDDYSFRLRFAHPFGGFLYRLASMVEFYAPKHYLKPYHPDVGDPELIAREMARRGMSSPRALYNQLKSWQNPEIPRMWPWIYRSYRANPPQVFVRNPYYWAVDSEGNQLPYIDEVVFTEVQPQLIPASASRGRVSMQNRHIRFADYTLLMSERDRGGYDVRHWKAAHASIWAIYVNINRVVHPREPDSAMKAELLRNVDFRRALSLAVDRQAIINALYSGVGHPSQISPGEDSPFHHPASAEAYIEFDPERANHLLDGIGLDRRDREGFRTFPDGSRMTWFLNYSEFTGPGPAEFVKDDWARVGIRVIPRDRSRALFTTEWLGLQHDFTVWTSESDFAPLIDPRSFVPLNINCMFATGYGLWFHEGGFFGLPIDERPAVVVPSEDHPLRRSMQAYVDAMGEPTLEEQVEAFRPALDIAAENVWTISIATSPPELAVVDRTLRNVPERGIVSSGYMSPVNMGIETFYFEEPRSSAAAQARIRREIQELVPMPLSEAAAVARQGAGQRLGSLIRSLFLFTLLALLVATGVRHPFIGRRLMIMIPTLLVVSMVSFTIIQLPPSDFLEVRLTQLELQGDETSRAEIEELRRVFHLDKPLIERYLRWMGFYWFTSFDRADLGLIQGDMGRSMETNTSVNTLVGDRILLTFLISLGTILFTWAVALPIGIYSAVRQYSIGDYIVTIFGFLGMCVPNFLLALILIFLAKEWFGIDAIGLFSPEFATQAHWDWPKVQDLLQHIWVPVLVLGIGGTAGMIRVMRGNLLDELRKPYVITARAKGVRPFKLLLKYPVRLALNPFISGIGGIFPQLVSGGAIVAIVLSLPTVGPLMLTAMMSQDTYLAGSMLMVLSLLGILGTLVSDLLLLWLDPRIRMEGGKR